MREDLFDMMTSFGEERSKTCLIRLENLLDLDTTALKKVNQCNWLPFSLIELDQDQLSKDRNILRLRNLDSIKTRLKALTKEDFVLTDDKGKGDFRKLILLID